jgi:xanthine dehydrogenase YagR molybdenum-binding subunit
MTIDPAILFGTPTPRVDGVAKVTGAARYASDEPVANPAFACLVTSDIARGHITGFDLNAAKAVSGVLDILTYETVGDRIKPPPGPDGGATTTTLESNRIWHDGQIIAVVVADTFEAATEAAAKVRVSTVAEPPAASFGAPGAEVQAVAAGRSGEGAKEDQGAKKAAADAAFTAAPIKVDVRYATPPQHHNPIELFTTTCVWDGPKLTVYEPSQFMWGLKTATARQLGIDPADVRTVSRYVGGAFGSRGNVTSRTAWVALAARRLGRPVKLVPTRAQGFTIATFRAETRQHVRLSATPDGKLTSVFHEGWEVTSRPSSYKVAGVEATSRLYAAPAIATAVNVVHADRTTPGFMRAPAEVPYMFALESAMDELSYALNMDPIELRRVNDTQTDPVSGLPFSSRLLMPCFDQAAERFGWRQRNPKPASMRDGAWLVGYGCATSFYPNNIGAAAVRISLMPSGRANVALAAHEIGNGAYTTVAITAAHALGLAVADVTVQMGDSDLPPVPVAGGSNNAASTTHVVVKACEDIRRRLAEAAVAAEDSPFHGADPTTLTLSGGALRRADGQGESLSKAVPRTGGRLEVYAENIPAGLPANAVAQLYDGRPLMSRGDNRRDVTAYAFGAHCVEVRVHSLTREIRVPRVVSAFASGNIINPTTAHSQYMGGLIWGISSALHEATEVDPASARLINANLADYMVPVNADAPSIEVIMVPEHDTRVNPLGVKGIGEIGIVGMNAAIANAVFHATGKRLRELPIRAEQLL